MSETEEQSIPWYWKMKSYIGQSCPTGKPTTPWIEETFGKHTTFNLEGITPPACAATMCRVLEETGYRSPHSAAAASFIGYGIPCELTKGAIVVLKHQFGPLRGHHHVTLVESIPVVYVPGTVPDRIIFLGGNQNHMVIPVSFDMKIHEIVSCAMPAKR